MARYDHIVRVVRLLERLEESRAGITAQQSAEDLGVSARTARRYLEALDRAGFPLDHDAGRYRLRPRPRAGSRLTEARRRQLVASAIVCAPLRGTPFAPDPVALQEDLLATPRQRDLFGRLGVPLSAPHRLAHDYRRHEATLQSLLKAHDESHVVRAHYYTASRGEWTVRDLDSYGFHYDPALETLYLFAYCHLRRDVRTFAAHRFRELHITRGVYRISPDFTVEGHLKGAFRVYRGGTPSRIVLTFTSRVAPWVGDRVWHASQERRDLAGGAVELRFLIDGEEEVLPWILSHGAEVRVQEPAWLAERVREEAGRLLGMYGDASVRGDGSGSASATLLASSRKAPIHRRS